MVRYQIRVAINQWGMVYIDFADFRTYCVGHIDRIRHWDINNLSSNGRMNNSGIEIEYLKTRVRFVVKTWQPRFRFHYQCRTEEWLDIINQLYSLLTAKTKI